MLAGQAQRRPTCDQHLQCRTGFEQLGHQCRRVHHLLEPIQQEQQLAVLQVQLDPLERRPLASVAHAEEPRDHRRDERRIVDRRQGDKAHVVGEVVPLLTGDLDRQAGLPDPARTGEGQEPHFAATEQIERLRDLVLPPN